jgi:hypothetical protein
MSASDLQILSGIRPLGLRETQSLFVRCLGALIDYAYAQGYELTLGEGLRSDGQGHMAGSNHYRALAQDLNLFVKGVWKDRSCKEWDDLGEYWKSLNPLCRWGGDFMHRDSISGKIIPMADLNHVSLEWNGTA